MKSGSPSGGSWSVVYDLNVSSGGNTQKKNEDGNVRAGLHLVHTNMRLLRPQAK
jgi:hypothetical protein